MKSALVGQRSVVFSVAGGRQEDPDQFGRKSGIRILRDVQSRRGRAGKGRRECPDDPGEGTTQRADLCT